MKKYFLLFCIFTTMLFSCSSSNDETDNIIPSDVLVKRMITNNNGFITESFFDYNNKKIAGYHNSHGNTKTFIYDGDKIIQIKWYDIPSQNSELLQTVDFDYNTDGTLKGFLTNFLNEQFNKIEFSYNSNSQVSYTLYSGISLNSLNLAETGIIYLTNNLVTQIVSTRVVSGNVATADYTYDNKNHPLKNVIGYDKLILYNIFYKDIEYDGFSTNAGASQNMVTGTGFTLHQYDYNTLNFPTKLNVGPNMTRDFFYE